LTFLLNEVIYSDPEKKGRKKEGYDQVKAWHDKWSKKKELEFIPEMILAEFNIGDDMSNFENNELENGTTEDSDEVIISKCSSSKTLSMNNENANPNLHLSTLFLQMLERWTEN